MSIIEYLQSAEGLKTTAFVAAFIVMFAFALDAHPFKKKRQLIAGVFVEVEEGPAPWYAIDFYNYVFALIVTAKTPDELRMVMVYIENYLDKEFKVPVSPSVRREYYNKLVNAYALKESEFEGIPVALCKN